MRRVKSLPKSGRVSVAKAKRATVALKKASAKKPAKLRVQAASKSGKASTSVLTSKRTATGRHLVSFRVASPVASETPTHSARKKQVGFTIA